MTPYQTQEKPIIPILVTIILWLLSTLHTELNWQVISLWIVAVYLTIQYWSWQLALLLLLVSFGTQNEVLWIKYLSMGIFAMLIWVTFVFSSHVSSVTSFAIETKASKENKKQNKENDESELWKE